MRWLECLLVGGQVVPMGSLVMGVCHSEKNSKMGGAISPDNTLANRVLILVVQWLLPDI